jgi:hypothetical protein
MSDSNWSRIKCSRHKIKFLISGERMQTQSEQRSIYNLPSNMVSKRKNGIRSGNIRPYPKLHGLWSVFVCYVGANIVVIKILLTQLTTLPRNANVFILGAGGEMPVW